MLSRRFLCVLNRTESLNRFFATASRIGYDGKGGEPGRCNYALTKGHVKKMIIDGQEFYVRDSRNMRVKIVREQEKQIQCLEDDDKDTWKFPSGLINGGDDYAIDKHGKKAAIETFTIEHENKCKCGDDNRCMFKNAGTYRVILINERNILGRILRHCALNINVSKEDIDTAVSVELNNRQAIEQGKRIMNEPIKGSRVKPENNSTSKWTVASSWLLFKAMINRIL
jgi:hypothetical protein